ncbi:hypothetical protein [Rhizobium sp. CCGE531]|uniref:hypothetical protein n=1 Tax=Rhizobium sp. CCGE531 TaxID=2364271 RepID=UPI000EAAB8D9|nr:hypothetical protein [Rhizobium sp. CCGE531]AYG70671.1 hypothetical protein CCGE531_32380 [Rhizobium sp. CCGE531]
MVEQIAEKRIRINPSRKIKALVAEADTARRVRTTPGIGRVLTAFAVEAFAPLMESFRYSRNFAA